MECEIPTLEVEETYEALLEAFQRQNYWVKFFMRPCCPPPGEPTARSLIEHLKSDIDAREDFSGDQRTELKKIADERLDWYLKLPVRHTS